MEYRLNVFFIIASVVTFLFVIRKIRKHGLNIDDSIVWILWSILLLIVSIFPGLPTWISNQLGFMSTSNFIFCLFIFFLYIMLFAQATEISKLREKQKELIQKLSIKEYEEKKGEKE
ncbi:DUF2304 domain-containing protein [Floccifex sp.]|uniref:DUF2304 domain-containing protein n=1 Tax=Floccifex sp. TaxID=2815810 RepID=UPI0029FEED84|nr:DUF2304 family protein [Floccifex sp.]MDD7281958.1 DUF2304 domain-containing protein [Erysipelotrichaceae bacterium]MDY2957853.1 DUF2304 domain-containing protein [Floccifex sp.]